MATFVLVHGSFGGGWVWRDVRAVLRAAGHEVYTPTLTGLGERRHLLRPDTGLATHIEDLVNVLHFEDLSGVILVGWGTGGMTITGAADRAPERIAQAVYLNAFVPRDGDSQLSLYPPSWVELIVDERAGLPVTNAVRAYQPEDDAYYADLIPDPERRAWYVGHLTPHPMRVSDDVIGLGECAERVPRTCIYFTTGQHGPVGAHAATLREWFEATPGWRFWERPLSHYAPVNTPEAVAAVLLETLTTSA